MVIQDLFKLSRGVSGGLFEGTDKVGIVIKSGQMAHLGDRVILG